MSGITWTDDNILSASVCLDNEGRNCVFFVLRNGNSESYLTEDDMREMLCAMCADPYPDDQIHVLSGALEACIRWMDLREKHVPGQQRIVDFAKSVLDGALTQPQGDGETKFTPGPWCVWHEGEDCSVPLLPISDWEGVWDISIRPAEQPKDGVGYYEVLHFDCNDDESLANAHLIAASPELYAALEAMCHGTDDMLEWAALVQRGREALRKARGESQ